MTIPSADIFDGLDWGKLIVVDIDVMGDSYKWFVYICDGVESLAFFFCGLVCLSNLIVQL